MARATPGARTSDRTVSVAVVDAGRDVVVIGIRHHSPACARIVAETIERLQPTHVLIEGPADFTDRIDELRLDHKLPIALYSHVRRGAHTRVTWAAFTDWSPEWIALRSASKVSAEVRLIDLSRLAPRFRRAAGRVQFGCNSIGGRTGTGHGRRDVGSRRRVARRYAHCRGIDCRPRRLLRCDPGR